MAQTASNLIQGTKSHERRYIFWFTITGDGTGDLVNQRMNVTSGDMGIAPRIKRIVASNGNFSSVIAWDATTPLTVFECPANHTSQLDLELEGGIPDLAGAGVTGNLVVSTKGLTAGQSGTYYVEVFKSNP